MVENILASTFLIWLWILNKVKARDIKKRKKIVLLLLVRNTTNGYGFKWQGEIFARCFQGRREYKFGLIAYK